MLDSMTNSICRDLNLDYGSFKVGDLIRVTFYCFISPEVGHQMRPVSFKFGTGGAAIEDIIAELPLVDKPPEVLKRYIRDDYRVSFGCDFPEYGVLSIAPYFPEMYPIVSYRLNESGQLKYLAHPQINLMMQRYR